MTKLELSSDIKKLNIEQIQQMLSTAFWSPGITAKEIQKGIYNSSLCVGAYNESGQIGFLRVISDKVRFAYILDVIVDKTNRRQGIGRRMVKFALEHPDLRDVYQWLLITQDAHAVYQKCGFSVLNDPEKWMSIRKPRPDRSEFNG